MPKDFFEDSQKEKNVDDSSSFPFYIHFEEKTAMKAKSHSGIKLRLMTSKWFDGPRAKGTNAGAEKSHLSFHQEIAANNEKNTTYGSTKNNLELDIGSIALYGEGDMRFVNYILKPLGDSSGVSIGKGYDMGSRSAESIIKDLTKAGLGKAQAEKISKAAYKKGKDADVFVAENKEAIGIISDEIILNLFRANWKEVRATAKNIATSQKAQKDNKGNYVNARGREINDRVKEGTYVLTKEEWDGLHPALIDLMTDMKFHGGYYIYDRVAQVNKAIKEHPNDQIGQLKAVRELFINGYIETYTSNLAKDGSFSKVKNDTTDIFYGKKVNMKGKYKRDLIRLTFLNAVIETLESGRKVAIGGVSSNIILKVTATNTSIISDTVGFQGKNNVEDVKKIQQLLYKAGFNISINGEADEPTIKAIKEFQKIKLPQYTPDGIVSPGKSTEKSLTEYSESHRVKSIVKEYNDAPKDNLVLQAYENYKKGTISMITLGSKLKENNYYFPKTTLNVFNTLPISERDNLAYTLSKQCSDEELKSFNIEVLVLMEKVLDTYIYTTSWSENLKQEDRVEQVLAQKGRIASYLTKSKAPTKSVTTFPTIASVGSEMVKERRYQPGNAYFDIKVGDKIYKSGEVVEGSKNTWCNQFAMDLAKRVTKDNPFKQIQGGQGMALVNVILKYMKDTPLLFQEVKIPFNDVWEKEVNKAQLVFFIEPNHIATGIPTKEISSRKDKIGRMWKFGEVIQAGASMGRKYLNQAWNLEDFKHLMVYKYIGK